MNLNIVIAYVHNYFNFLNLIWKETYLLNMLLNYFYNQKMKLSLSYFFSNYLYFYIVIIYFNLIIYIHVFIILTTYIRLSFYIQFKYNIYYKN
jgi:hypothetical protein